MYGKTTNAASMARAGLTHGAEFLILKNFPGTGVARGSLTVSGGAFAGAFVYYLEEGFSSLVYTGYTLITNERLDYFKHDGLWLDYRTVASSVWLPLRARQGGVAGEGERPGGYSGSRRRR